MIIPLSIFLYIYLFLFAIFAFFSFFNLYHMIRFSFWDFPSFFATFLFIAAVTIIAFISFEYIRQIDWQQTVIFNINILDIGFSNKGGEDIINSAFQ